MRASTYVVDAANHFGHRETGGVAVDLFWTRDGVEHEFRVEVEDRREGARYVLYPTTGREAIQAYHHPFAAIPGIGQKLSIGTSPSEGRSR
jgi:hypothetical protein